MIRLVLLTVLLGLLFYGGQRLWRAWAPRWSGQWRRIATIGGALLLLLLALALSGRLTLLLAALGTAGVYLARRLPQLLRWAPLLQRWWRQARAFGLFTGRFGMWETAWLRLPLDYADGEVLAGRFAGWPLRELSLDQLLELFRELRSADAPSAALLETYLDRTYGAEWRRVAESGQAKRGPSAADSGKMSREEAYKVLGLTPAATPKDIVAAHRRLMQKFHPDRGGSDHLAAKINQAKDLLSKK